MTIDAAPLRSPIQGKATAPHAWRRAAAATFAIAWGGNEFTPLLVMYRQSEGLSAITVDMLLFAYVLGIVPALLIGGPLSDRLGRRPLMLPAPALAAAGSLVLALGTTSVPLLIAGRVLSGVALGLAMAVGGSWIKELSSAPWGDDRGGIRRAAMSLTAGFGAGAGVAGVLAQWAPWPGVLPYAVNIVLSLVAAGALLRAPETRSARDDGRSLRADLTIPSAGHRRFLFVVAPLAPWVFGAAASAYAVLPALMTDHVSRAPVAFSALLCVVTLGCGFLAQTLGRRIDDGDGVRAVVVALIFVVAGMALAALAATRLSVWTAVPAAALLGCGYGLALVAGLQQVQRIAGPDDLAGLTAVFYGISYLGFGVPVVLALGSQALPAVLTYPAMFGLGAIAALLCLGVVIAGHRAHRPAAAVPPASL
ncbi:MFS transporter [Mycolicibacterium sp. CH28]|uniref:MFS transporter n=1 Tax=Mycolicibacterium sp. CH28 TaxID=2512237 RepID=UPI0010819152|nr:MFS transporter [Mycolicibacterium sp. CH28]TGD84127.1 MFS transporter [Mycolicibacterium sp. CH28]